MKIIQGTGAPKPIPEAHADAAPDMGRLEALENIAKSILQKLQVLEERVDAVEKNPFAPASSIEPVQPTLSAPQLAFNKTLDADALKKGLLTKMWKYLNDKRPAKAA